jgi:hypothetical protein
MHPSVTATCRRMTSASRQFAISILFALAAIIPPRSMDAQSKFVGRWLVRYEHEIRGVHVGAPQLVVDTVRMTLRQRGDSVIGDWQAIAAAGEPAPRGRELRGVMRSDTVRLQLDPNLAESEGFFTELGREIVEFLKTHVHGIPPMTPYVEFTMRGDSLVGSRWSASADFSAETPKRALWALREKP